MLAVNYAEAVELSLAQVFLDHATISRLWETPGGDALHFDAGVSLLFVARYLIVQAAWVLKMKYFASVLDSTLLLAQQIGSGSWASIATWIRRRARRGVLGQRIPASGACSCPRSPWFGCYRGFGDPVSCS